MAWLKPRLGMRRNSGIWPPSNSAVRLLGAGAGALALGAAGGGLAVAAADAAADALLAACACEMPMMNG